MAPPAEPSVLPEAPSHSDVPLKKTTSQGMEGLCHVKGQRWDQVFPAMTLFLEHRRLEQAHTLALQQHEAVTVFEHRAGASMEKAQLYPEEAGKAD